MTQIFNGESVPNIDELPITQAVVDALNDAKSNSSGDVAYVIIEALVLQTALLERKVNRLMDALGAKEVLLDE